MSLAAGEVKSLHFGTECHSGFSPAAVQIRHDLSQALCEASWSSRAEEGAGRREGAGEVTLLQNTKQRPHTGSGDTAGPIQLRHLDARLGFCVSDLSFGTGAHHHHTKNEAVCKQCPGAVRRLGNGKNLLRLLRDASAAISMATGYCSIRSKSNPWRLRFYLLRLFLWLRPWQTDRQSHRQTDRLSVS